MVMDEMAMDEMAMDEMGLDEMAISHCPPAVGTNYIRKNIYLKISANFKNYLPQNISKM